MGVYILRCVYIYLYNLYEYIDIVYTSISSILYKHLYIYMHTHTYIYMYIYIYISCIILWLLEFYLILYGLYGSSTDLHLLEFSFLLQHH